MPWVKIITWVLLSMQRPYIRPYAYSTFNPAVYWSHCCCYYFTTTAVISPLLLIICVKEVYFQVQLNLQFIC